MAMNFARSITRLIKTGSAQASLFDLVLLVCADHSSCELQDIYISSPTNLNSNLAASLSNLVLSLAEEFILIQDQNNPLGILTEIDLLRGIAKQLSTKESLAKESSAAEENSSLNSQTFLTSQDLLNAQTKVIYQQFTRSLTPIAALGIYQQTQTEYFILQESEPILEQEAEQESGQISKQLQAQVYCLTDILQELQQSAMLKKHSVSDVMEPEIIALSKDVNVREVVDYMLSQQKPYAVIKSSQPKSSDHLLSDDAQSDSKFIIITCLEVLQLWLSHHQNPEFGDTPLSSLISFNHARFFYGIELQESLWSTLRQMQKLQVNHLLVIERSLLNQTEKLVGVISLKNLCKIFTLESMYGEIESLEQNLNLALTQKAELLLNCIDRVGSNNLMGDDFSQLQIEQEYKVALATLMIRQSFSLEEILETTVAEVSNWLQADRVLLYQFLPNGTEQIVAEAVLQPHLSLINQPLARSFLESCWLEFYDRGIARVINDLDNSPDTLEPISERDRQFLLQFGVKSSLVAAIPQGKRLWGLLVIHQCSMPRQWHTAEIEFIERLAPRLSINFHQAILLANSLTEFDERREVERKLLHNALHDPLTDLPNRILVLERLEFLSKQSVTNFALVLFDLNRFKLINDGLGHLTGDRVLQELVLRLSQIIGTSMLARIGGDEFVILLENLTAENQVIQMIEELQALLQQPFNLTDQAANLDTDLDTEQGLSHNVVLSASVGVVLGGSFSNNPAEILRDADAAMQFAKRQLRPYAFFAEPMRQEVLLRLQLENDLRQALKQQDFSLQYQPIIDPSLDKIVGFEALLRWTHLQRGVVYPQDFIPIIEETGLIVPIGAWVLQTACEQMRQWQQYFPHQLPLTISVNVSNVQVEQPGFVDLVQQVLIDTGLPPSSLHLEITESVLMQNITQTHQKLETLRSLGVEIHIDDFGTGYSSFSYLQNLPVDGLKIDRSFMIRITEDDSSRQIVQAIINLAQGLGKSIVAEGIETEAQLRCFMAMAEEGVQGYYFSKPVTPEAAAKLIEEGLPEKMKKASRDS